MLMDSLSSSLAVGPITESDFILLSRGYGRVNWDYVINKYNPDDSFDFCFKLKGIDCRSGVLSGAFISSFILEKETLEIYGIENFSDDVLKGKMFLYSLFACLIFMKKLDGKYIKLVVFIRATSCTLRELILWVLKIIVKRNLLRRKRCC